MGRKYQSGFIHHQPLNHSDKMYKSSFYVDQAHTNRRIEDKIEQKPPRSTSNNLYLDPQTGVIYRYIPNKSQPTTVTYYQPTTQMKTSKDLYKCDECGSITTYYHRHHMSQITANDIDDPGYESGNKKINRHRRYISDSDPDEISTSLDISILNEAYERAKKAQHHSQNLSKHISRQLRLVLGTI